MIIYKITNKTTGKIYIGQTINSLEQRWNRHCNDALNNILNTHFARAIRLYGKDDFIQQVIDTANSQEELTAKERYWINYYNSVKEGYNETDAESKCGGNTYKNKTEEELTLIKEKIRESKLGEKNPNATGVKCKNINTNEQYHFGSQSEMQTFFNETNHQFCSRRCRGEIKCLYKNEWIIAYQQNDYPINYTIKGKTPKKGTQINFTDIKNNKLYTFHSLREAQRELKTLGYSFTRDKISQIIKNERPQIEGYKFEIIK